MYDEEIKTEGEKKLSQLLGEYMEEKKKNPEGFLGISTALMAGFKATDAYMISKQFGFIEWLVQNDKIDFKKNKLQVLKDIDVRGEVMYDYTLFDKADGVIMLLAISDNPIEDLISYLK